MLQATQAHTQNDIVSHLNATLKHALTGINQYFLHARMLKHKEFMKLADYEYKESLDTMKYTDQLVNLILSLDGAPNLQDLGSLRVGQTVPDILRNDLALVEATRGAIADAINCNNNGENVAALKVLKAMLKSEEDHEQFLKQQIRSIETMGINAYLQTQM